MKQVFRHLCLVLLFGCADSDEGFQFGSESGNSQSASIAQFQIVDDFLYVVESHSLSVFDIADYSQINRLTKILLEREIETIHRLENVLYLGTTTGVLFYDISDRSSPNRLAVYEHLTSCDPVVANSKYAFSTLRSGVECRNGANTLDVIEISDLTNPKLIGSYAMSSPYGMGLMGDNLFVGQKYNGMIWLDVSDGNKIIEIGRFNDIHAIDFIVDQEFLFIQTVEGLGQYRVSGTELVLLDELDFNSI